MFVADAVLVIYYSSKTKKEEEEAKKKKKTTNNIKIILTHQYILKYIKILLWVFVLIYLNSLYNKYNINTKGVFIQFIIIVKKEDSDGGSSRDYQLFCIYFLV